MAKPNPQFDDLRRRIMANQEECKRLNEIATATPEYAAYVAAMQAYDESEPAKAYNAALAREGDLDEESPGGCHMTCELCACPLFEDSKVHELYSDEGGAMMCTYAATGKVGADCPGKRLELIGDAAPPTEEAVA